MMAISIFNSIFSINNFTNHREKCILSYNANGVVLCKNIERMSTYIDCDIALLLVMWYIKNNYSKCELDKKITLYYRCM